MTKYGDSAVTGRICEMFGVIFVLFDKDTNVFILFLEVVNLRLHKFLSLFLVSMCYM